MDWLEPWGPVTKEHATALVAELVAELRPGHALHGIGATALGARADQDDVLFALDDGRVAVVHLTWAGSRERPPWPGTRVYADLGDWIARGMAADHANWTEPR